MEQASKPWQEVFVRVPIICRENSVLLPHATLPGGSGGPYFTSTGALFALHRGRPRGQLQSDSESEADHDRDIDIDRSGADRIAIFPWKATHSLDDSHLLLTDLEAGGKLPPFLSFTQLTQNYASDDVVKIEQLSRMALLRAVNKNTKSGVRNDRSTIGREDVQTFALVSSIKKDIDPTGAKRGKSSYRALLKLDRFVDARSVGHIIRCDFPQPFMRSPTHTNANAAGNIHAPHHDQLLDASTSTIPSNSSISESMPRPVVTGADSDPESDALLEQNSLRNRRRRNDNPAKHQKLQMANTCGKKKQKRKGNIVILLSGEQKKKEEEKKKKQEVACLADDGEPVWATFYFFKGSPAHIHMQSLTGCAVHDAPVPAGIMSATSAAVAPPNRGSNPDSSQPLLSSLSGQGHTLSPPFDANQHEYRVGVLQSTSSLCLYAHVQEQASSNSNSNGSHTKVECWSNGKQIRPNFMNEIIVPLANCRPQWEVTILCKRVNVSNDKPPSQASVVTYRLFIYPAYSMCQLQLADLFLLAPIFLPDPLAFFYMSEIQTDAAKEVRTAVSKRVGQKNVDEEHYAELYRKITSGDGLHPTLHMSIVNPYWKLTQDDDQESVELHYLHATPSLDGTDCSLPSSWRMGVGRRMLRRSDRKSDPIPSLLCTPLLNIHDIMQRIRRRHTIA